MLDWYVKLVLLTSDEWTKFKNQLIVVHRDWIEIVKNWAEWKGKRFQSWHFFKEKVEKL